jgi:glycerophosphoryl diester phosphodiesterase
VTLRLAHRGDWRVAPENTIPAFMAALRIPGCDGLEFDVHTSLDGKAVLLHDDDLDRVQGVRVNCNDLTAAELQDLGVPTLAQTLSAVGGQPFLDVELKQWVPDALAVLEAARGKGMDGCVISCFEVDVIAEVRRLRPSWPTWLNSETLDQSVIERAKTLGCTGISAEWPTLTPAMVRAVASAGLLLATWTVRRRPTYQRLERFGVVAICAEAAALDG